MKHRYALLAIVLGIAALQSLQVLPNFGDDTPAESRTEQQAHSSDEVLARAFAERRNNLQIEGEGTVLRLLPDDNKGSRHQRFLLRLRSGQTLLVAHNIDLAPRIESLREGDGVRFYGEYEWNERGGVIHWTHHDPDGDHPHGWLEHEGKRYQ